VDDVVTTQLADRRTLAVRPTRRGDVDALLALHAALDADDRLRRFFSLYHPRRDFFEDMASVCERGGFGLVALVEDELVAEAAYELLPDGDGELSIVVARAWRGWLGPYLLELLRRGAAARGVRNLRADVLATNTPMVAMLTAHGAAHRHDDDWCVLHLVIGTAGAPTWPPRRRRRRVIAEVPGGRWASGATAVKAGFDVLVCSGPRVAANRCPAIRGAPCPLVTDADIVVTRPPRDGSWDELLAAHAAVHAGTPVVTPADDDELRDLLARQDLRP
jgi:hypothetical protein